MWTRGKVRTLNSCFCLKQAGVSSPEFKRVGHTEILQKNPTAVFLFPKGFPPFIEIPSDKCSSAQVAILQKFAARI